MELNQMPKNLRSKNMDLIRWLCGSHEATVKRLRYVTNSTYISKMALGVMEVGDRKARSIEKALELPPGWLDRDNVAVLNMSTEQFAIQQIVKELSSEARAALLTLLSACQR